MSITYHHDLAMIVNYDRNRIFLVLATIIMIVNHDHNFCMVQVTDYYAIKLNTTRKSFVMQAVKVGNLFIVHKQ
jgi:hypothetical protein